MKQELINVALFEQKKESGHEVKYKERNGKKIGASIVDPIKKLYEKGHITLAECRTADLYSIDLEISLQENYAQAVSTGLPSGTSEYCFEDKRLQASKRVNDTKNLVIQISRYEKRELKNVNELLLRTAEVIFNEQVLKYSFERRLSNDKVEKIIAIHRDKIIEKCKQIAKVIFNYYEN